MDYQEVQFQVYNTNMEERTLILTHRLSLDKCTCTAEEDDKCIFYCVGYNLNDLCEALELDNKRPLYLNGPNNLQLEVIDSDNIGAGGLMVLIPVHKTTPLRKGTHN